MTSEQVLAAVEKYEKILGGRADLPPTRFSTNGLLPSRTDCLRHALWMTRELRKHLSGGKVEKAMRWLGFVQGVLWSLGVVSIEEMKDDNR